MERTILRKRNIDGQTVDIRVRETSPGNFALQVLIDGLFVSGPQRPEPYPEPQGTFTHYVGGGYGDRQVVPLTPTEVDMINRALRRAETQPDAMSTQQLRALVARRLDLTREYRRLVERRDAELAAGGAEELQRSLEAKVAAARQAIRQFDREYPEIARAALGGTPEGG